jgi:bud emergence protein 1
MKSLRRSLNNDSKSTNTNNSNSQPSPPLPGPHNGSISKPSSGKVAPPQKVIKALKTHRSTNPQELSYQEGDFWYVTSETDGWYQALSMSLFSIYMAWADVIDPLTGSRGLVPKSDFDEFMKGGRLPSVTSQRSGSSENIAARYVQSWPSYNHTDKFSRSQTPSQNQFSPVSNTRSPPPVLQSPPPNLGPPRKP